VVADCRDLFTLGLQYVQVCELGHWLTNSLHTGESCDGDRRVRLVGGPNEFEGRVEVCVDGVWARWCAEGIVENEAVVICRQLGHTNGGK
jgi:hypothetical protein